MATPQPIRDIRRFARLRARRLETVAYQTIAGLYSRTCGRCNLLRVPDGGPDRLSAACFARPPLARAALNRHGAAPVRAFGAFSAKQAGDPPRDAASGRPKCYLHSAPQWTTRAKSTGPCLDPATRCNSAEDSRLDVNLYLL